jgi:CubicO group peptidase (beta-lactamase class C family)
MSESLCRLRSSAFMSEPLSQPLSRRRALRTLGLSAAAFLIARPSRLFAGDLGAAQMQAAAQYSAAHTGVAMLVMQGGRVIFEDYQEGQSPRALRKIYSGTKGFWILAALKAAEEGILDLDERVAATIEEWQSDAGKARVTLRQLLTFSSGLDAANQLHADDFDDRDATAVRTPLVAAPGGAFIYGPAPLQVFHEVLKRKLAGRGETATKYLERKVLRPMGLGPQRYLPDRHGNPLLATGFMMTTRQWARMGQLIMDGGSPVVSRGSLAACFRGSPANCAFGMGFWNNAMADARSRRELDVEDMLEPKWYRQNWSGACLCSDAPSDLVAAIGSGYQRLFVIPSKQLVVVRQGKFGRMSDGHFLRLLLGA